MHRRLNGYNKANNRYFQNNSKSFSEKGDDENSYEQFNESEEEENYTEKSEEEEEKEVIDKNLILKTKRKRTQTQFYHNERDKYLSGKYHGRKDVYDRDYHNRDGEVIRFVNYLIKNEENESEWEDISSESEEE